MVETTQAIFEVRLSAQPEHRIVPLFVKTVVDLNDVAAVAVPWAHRTPAVQVLPVDPSEEHTIEANLCAHQVTLHRHTERQAHLI
jgi:hypothetical protein